MEILELKIYLKFKNSLNELNSRLNKTKEPVSVKTDKGNYPI